METQYLIVGSGLTGATIARILHDSYKNVLVIDRRSHLGGNVYDHHHFSGIRIHTYGPHYFRTTSDTIWSFVNKYSSFYHYEAKLKSFVDGRYENWPIAASYISREVGENWKPSFVGKTSNFEEAALAIMPEKVYHKFVKGYNIKQWGVHPSKLSADLVKRFDVRKDDDPRLMPHHKYQGIPTNGYAKFMQNLLKGIPVVLNVDYLKYKHQFHYTCKVIYTGPIDEYFNYCYGKLNYRGQNRVHEYIPDADFVLPIGQVNNPLLNNGPHIRTLEWKHMMHPESIRNIKGSVITKEITVTPINSEDYEYPFPDSKNDLLYQQYLKLANEKKDLLICGRLGEYKYYDMDQAIGRAMLIAKKLLQQSI